MFDLILITMQGDRHEDHIPLSFMTRVEFEKTFGHLPKDDSMWHIGEIDDCGQFYNYIFVKHGVVPFT